MKKETKKQCFITGAGEFFGFVRKPDVYDLNIAVDGGYEHLKKLKIKPDIIIGDFDSLNDKLDSNNGIEKIILPKEKDETDTFAAVMLGLEKKCGIFHIYGGTEGRFDHTYANIQCLAFIAENKAQGFLYGKNYIITVIKDGEYTIGNIDSGYVSVFTYSEKAFGVSIKDLKYELDNVTLDNGIPLGVSNELIGKAGKISVKKGVLVIVFPIK